MRFAGPVTAGYGAMTTALRRAMADLGRWAEGDGEIRERLSPGATTYDVPGGTAWGDGISVDDGLGGKFHVAAAGRAPHLVTARTWFSGMDDWEAAGRPASGPLYPVREGMQCFCQPEDGLDEAGSALSVAVIALRDLLRRPRADDASREAAFVAVEAAAAGLARRDLADAGLPDWLATDDAPAPGFGR